MKRIALFILVVMAVSTNGLAQGGRGAPPPPAPLEPGASQADVDKALLALPENLRNQAMVIKWKPDFTYDTLRKGTNGLVCFDRSGFPEQQPIAVECTSVSNLDREAQNLKAEALGDRAKTQAMLADEEKAGTRVKPAFGSVWYHFAGADQEHARRHLTVAVPGATAESLGLPDKPTQSGIWIMNAGTTTAHLMIPGQ
jgi:hypothetical protein